MTRRHGPAFLALAVLAALTGCSSSPPPLDPSSPEARAAVLAKQGDEEEGAGRLRDALDAYRDAARLVPASEGYRARSAEIRDEFVSAGRAEAEAALSRGEPAAARRAALALVEVDPESPAGYHVLASAAEAEGKLEDAFAAAQSAHARALEDATLTEALADLAVRTSRFAEAEALYGSLVKDAPALEVKRTAARREFQIQNLPASARKAVTAARLTRAQLAVLLLTLVPEVSSARVASGGEVATDVLDRPERTALVKAIALGFFPVSRGTHLVGPDAPVTRSEMAGHLRRLAGLRGEANESCLRSLAALATCGILPETTSRQVTGREAFAALDATLRLSR